MTIPAPGPPRWENYLLHHGDALLEFWQNYLAADNRRIMFILGRGFDPRMCIGIDKLFSLDGIAEASVRIVEFDEGEDSPSAKFATRVSANSKLLEHIVAGKGLVSSAKINMWSFEGERRRRIGSLRSGQLFRSIGDFGEATDIIVDISSLPRSIYMPLIASILHILDSNESSSTNKQNLHVWVSENPNIDLRIRDEEIDEQADFVHGFRGGLDMEATEGVPIIWIPFLGEGQSTQLDRISNLLKPDEICPVLPSPSQNPRRGDDLILEYREFLFDQLNIEPRNFIYADERNPFEVYRQVRRTIFHYRDALSALGGCKTGLSALSTKLMSIGAFLVAYELKSIGLEVGIAHVEADGYNVDEVIYDDSSIENNEVFGMWLSGTCYEN